MNLLLGLIPLFLVLVAFIIFRYNGRKELLKMDLVQFIYAFVITPTIFIWLKTFTFINLKDGVGVTLDIENLYLIDTVLTVIFIYVFAFIVIHSLTKSFQLKKEKEMDYDMFLHSEYFHLWLSHIVFYSGGLILVLFLGILNLSYPITLIDSNISLWVIVSFAMVAGLMDYIAILFANPGNKHGFDRVIKIQMYLYTLVFLILYQAIRPKYSAHYAVFWFSMVFFITTSLLSPLLRRMRFAKRLFVKFYWRKQKP